MEDLRRKKIQDEFERNKKIYQFFIFVKKNWLKILTILFIINVLVFPGFFGNVIGMWYNKFVTAILNNLTF